MKNDPMTTILNFVLAIIVIACVGFGWLASKRAANVQNMALVQNQVNAQEVRFQGLVNDVSSYNQQAKSPEIARMLQTLMGNRPAANK